MYTCSHVFNHSAFRCIHSYTYIYIYLFTCTSSTKMPVLLQQAVCGGSNSSSSAACSFPCFLLLLHLFLHLWRICAVRGKRIGGGGEGGVDPFAFRQLEKNWPFSITCTLYHLLVMIFAKTVCHYTKQMFLVIECILQFILNLA